MKLHYNTLKETGEVGDWRSEAARWHLSAKFHLLCQDLTNCSTHCKHGSQPLLSKWGLHTPFQISWPVWNFPLKFLCIVALPHSLNLRSPPPPKHHTDTKRRGTGISLPADDEPHFRRGASAPLAHWNALNEVTARASLCHVKRPGIKASDATHPCG